MGKNENMLKVAVWRGFGGKTAQGEGRFENFRVPARKSQTVLDVVSWIQQNADPTLSYRYACRVGMCGSCAMMVNGRPRWTCRTHVGKLLKGGIALEIAPLRNLPVVKDLVADLDPFFDKWLAADGVFHPTRTRDDAMEAIKPDTPQRLAANQAIECINCAICHAACDVVAANPDYQGPAALNRAWSLINDSRDGAHLKRFKAVSGTGGCHNCHSQQGCSSHCPNELNPTASIAGLKRETMRSILFRGR